MKRTMIAIASLALLAGLASCQKEGTGKEIAKQTEEVEIGHVTLTASFPKTRVSYAETAANNLKPSWEVGDKIFCTADGKTYYKFTVDTIKDDGSATISSESAPTDGTVCLIYQKGLESKESLSATVTFIFSDQSGDKTMPNVLAAIGTITDGTGNFVFESANSVVGVSCAKALAGKTVKSVTVGGKALSKASGRYNTKSICFEMKTGTTTAEGISTADLTSKNITVGADGVFSEPVFIAVPAGAVIQCVVITPTEGQAYPIVFEHKTTVANQYYYVKDTAVPAPPEGAIKGLFSVSPTKQVYFSPGNLKYTICTQKWEFFENQYDFDKGEGTDTIKPSTEYISFFCWGYNSENSIKPDDESENDSFVDWGSLFADGNTWRTLTKDEWNYLISYKTKDIYIRKDMVVFGVTVNGVEDCVVLYPDGYSGTKVTTMDSSTYNSEEAYLAATAEGIVFLPMTGYREITYDYNDYDYYVEHEDYPYVPIINEGGNGGYYWTSSQGSSGAYSIRLGNGTGGVTFSDEQRSLGHAVRLVSDFNR